MDWKLDFLRVSLPILDMCVIAAPDMLVFGQ